MDYTIIIPVLAYVAIIADIAFRLLKQPKEKEALGKCLLPLSRKIKKTNFILIFLILVFVALLFVRKFQLIIEVVFALIAVMAVDMAVQDFFLQQLNGIYENAIIHGRFETACVQALFLFVMIFILTRIQFLCEKRFVHYQ